jgi:uncharacterized protein
VPTARPTPRREARRTPGALPADFEAAGTGGLLALVLDDVGFEDGSLARLASFDGPLALAVIPTAPRAREAALLAKKKGWDLLVHLPMDSEAGRPEPESLGSKDDDLTIRARVVNALERVPGAIGLNNHQGSAATQDARVARAILSVLQERRLFFVDSRTTAGSVAEKEARALGVPTVSRDVFLDDAAAEAAAPGGATEALDAAWKRAVDIAVRRSPCVVIAHPHRATLDFLAARLPALDAGAVRRVRVSELVE